MNEVSFSRTVKKVTFGAWSLDPKRQCIFDGEVERELEPLLFKILCYLIINNEQIITRQDLVDDVWCQNYVDDNAINRAMSELRKVLKSDRQRGVVVKTHYRKGYSFFPDAHIEYFDKKISIPEKEPIESIITTSADKPIRTSPLKVVMIILAFLIFGIIYTKLPSDYTKLTSSEADVKITKVNFSEQFLSWMTGKYTRVILSPNKALAVFSFIPRGQDHEVLVLKNLIDGSESKIGDKNLKYYPIGWSSDSNRIFYRLTSEGVCEVWQISTDFISYNSHLFDCQNGIKKGGGVGDGHFVYSKHDYRGRDQLSALTNRDLQTGEEFQISSPNLNSYGDEFLLYEKSLNAIFFERHLFDSVELYMTDPDGSNQSKLFESKNRIWSINYVKEGNKLVWFDNQKNELIEYSLSTKSVVQRVTLNEDKVYASHHPISIDEMLAVSYPFAQDIYRFNLDIKELESVIQDDEIQFSAIYAKNEFYFIKRYVGNNAIYRKKGAGENIRADFPSSNYRSIKFDEHSERFLLAYPERLEVYSKDFELLDTIFATGTIVSAEFLLEGRIGYIELSKEHLNSSVFIYSINEKQRHKMPLKHALWFDQYKDSVYIYLSSKDELSYFDSRTGDVVKTLSLPNTGEPHIFEIGNEQIFYSRGSKVFQVNDDEIELIKNLGAKQIFDMSYSSHENELIFSTVEEVENQLLKLLRP